MNKLTIISLILGFASSTTIAVAETKSTNTSTYIEETKTNVPPENTGEMVTKAESFAFNFNNAFDYSSCMDIILLTYQLRFSCFFSKTRQITRLQIRSNTLVSTLYL